MSAEAISGSISVIVNGDARAVGTGLTVTQLLQTLGIHGGRVAIERNLQILPRAEWDATAVLDGDRYEIVQFVGGG